MNRLALICLAIAALTQTPRASADPMTLNVQGTALGLPIDESWNVSNGFFLHSIPDGQQPLATMPGFSEPAVGASGSLSSSYDLTATLTMGDRSVSTILTSPVAISYERPGTSPDLVVSTKSLDVASTFTMTPSLDPATIPLWFKGLSAWIIADPGGDPSNAFHTELVIAPSQEGLGGTTSVPPPPPPPVPEPSTFAVLLIGIAALRLWRNPSRRS